MTHSLPFVIEGQPARRPDRKPVSQLTIASAKLLFGYRRA